MNFNKLKIYLAVAGIILTVVGSIIAFGPIAYLDAFNIHGDPSSGILSELRGMGGSLFVFGLFVILGSAYKKFERNALIISALIFSSFVLFRSVSILVDGMPNDSILVALLIEFFLSAIALLFIVKHETHTKHGGSVIIPS